MIDELINLIGQAIALLFVGGMISARVKVECELDWNVGGVDRNGVITCMEPIRERCCGEPAGVVCERACKPTRTSTRRIYCTGGSRAVVINHRTVGCTR